jgi:hypothetical protein
MLRGWIATLRREKCCPGSSSSMECRIPATQSSDRLDGPHSFPDSPRRGRDLKTHHGGRCIDERAYQAGVNCIPPTNFPSPDEDVHVDQIPDMSGHSLMKTKMPASSPKNPNVGLQVVTLCTWESLNTPIIW